MELKKSKKANLEQKTMSFRLLGLVMVCAVVGMAFEHTEYSALDEEPIVQQESGLTPLIPIPLVDPPEEKEETPPPPPLIIIDVEPVPDDVIVEDIEIVIVEIRDEVTVDTTTVVVAEKIYEFTDIEPTFPGGAGAMNQWIVDNIDYPELSREMGEQGIVYLQFVVSSKGNIEKVSIRQGVSDALDAEAKRVVRKMPKWNPGEQAGKPVSVKFTLPISFRLG
jgi:protein TonB